MMANFGQDALFSILSHLVFIGLSFWALQAVRLDQLIKANHIFQARLLFVVLSIAIGSTVSNFFLDYFLWSRQLPLLFQ
ncbi:DUF1146 family protein [Bacillus badius]|uniref:DUF1146 domain-containing protein n=1 Tax=Bacillus badius TaxID=1455 RepID=A0ABR5AVC0_BACBA|nr:DUF1146 family protein [Bacillus badius]KIL76543.1 hypothetical protein SD78_0645 [Bacillus badius]KIL78659.1 hypothetical protein SD77_4339 [Bacillus badius]KZN99948.1 hypothetical protein A4244_03350 [Bacillus badius]KZR57584.1 hypothetical protein A3781_02015 [Bacillus badius]MED0665995.1 DUF1146 family protein [Bacillus badius]